MSACSQILGKTFGPKTMAPTETKKFHFSLKMRHEKRKIDFLHFWPNLGDFEGIFHGFSAIICIFLKIGMLEIKNCLV